MRPAINKVSRTTSFTTLVRTALLIALVLMASATGGRLLAQVGSVGFWNAVASGGRSHSSETLSMTDTIGQSVVGRMASQSLGLIVGFQAGLGLQPVVQPVLTDLAFKKFVFSNGGETSGSEMLAMVDTMGQPVIGPASAVGNAIRAGFLAKASSSVGQPVCGDLNGDGLTDVIDAIILLQILVGRFQPEAEQVRLADVDGSGALNVLDGILFLRHIVGEQAALSCNGA